MKKRLAFTLSEILISVAILGIICLIIFWLLNNERNQTDLLNSHYNKAYNDVYSAAKAVVNLDKQGDLRALTTANVLRDAFEKRFNIVDDFDTNNPPDYLTNEDGIIAEKKLNPNDFAGFTLENGTAIAFSRTPLDTYPDSIGVAVVDVNSSKGPNKGQKDQFILPIYKDGIRDSEITDLDRDGAGADDVLSCALVVPGVGEAECSNGAYPNCECSCLPDYTKIASGRCVKDCTRFTDADFALPRVYDATQPECYICSPVFKAECLSNGGRFNSYDCTCSQCPYPCPAEQKVAGYYDYTCRCGCPQNMVLNTDGDCECPQTFETGCLASFGEFIEGTCECNCGYVRQLNASKTACECPIEPDFPITPGKWYDITQESCLSDCTTEIPAGFTFEENEIYDIAGINCKYTCEDIKVANIDKTQCVCPTTKPQGMDLSDTNKIYDPSQPACTKECLTPLVPNNERNMCICSETKPGGFELTESEIYDSSQPLSGCKSACSSPKIPNAAKTVCECPSTGPNSATGCDGINYNSNTCTCTPCLTPKTPNVAKTACECPSTGPNSATGCDGINYTSETCTCTACNAPKVPNAAKTNCVCPDGTPYWSGGNCVACPTGTGFVNNHCSLSESAGSCAAGDFAVFNDHTLDDVRNNLSGSYCMINNIDLSESGFFEPIGALGSAFTGKFNGNGYAINGLKINKPSTDNVGLFGYVSGSSSVIKNVALIGVNITGQSSVGAAAGSIRNGAKIQNVYATGTVGALDFVGGLVGMAVDNVILSSTYTDVTVSGATAGGLVGSNQSNSIIRNSYTVGTVTGSISAGGLIGINQLDSQIQNSYSIAAVNGSAPNKGAIYGWNTDNATVSNVYWDKTKVASAGVNDVGAAAHTNVIGLLTGHLSMTPTTKIYAGWLESAWCFNCDSRPVLKNMPSGAPSTDVCDALDACPCSTWADSACTNSMGVLAGDCACACSAPMVSVNNYTECACISDAQSVCDSSGGIYIDDGLCTCSCSGYKVLSAAKTSCVCDVNALKAGCKADGMLYNEPSCTCSACPSPKVLSEDGLSCQCPSDSCATDGSEITNTEDCSCSSVCQVDEAWDPSTSSCVSTPGQGSAATCLDPDSVKISTVAELNNTRNNLAGSYCLVADIDLQNASWVSLGGMDVDTMEDLPFTGRFDGNGHIIKNLSIASSGYYAGFFGATQNATISRLGLENISFSSSGYSTGGLVGSASTGTLIDQCYVSSGNITYGESAGGLAGSLYNATIQNSYSTVTLGEGCQLAGLVGSMSSSSVINSYATGAMSGYSYCDGYMGLIGSNYSGTITASYWDKITSGTTSSNGGTGKTTVEMQVARTDSNLYSTWDEDIWCFEAGSYPQLKAVIGTNNICVSCPISSPAYQDGSCVTCLEKYGSARPINNNGKCEACPGETPKWNGTECEACPTGAVWNGSACVCLGGQTLVDGACACPAEKLLWVSGDSSSTLLLHFDGENNSKEIVDSSPNNLPVTVLGGAKLSADKSKFGGSSLYLDGVDSYLQIDSPDKFDFADKDFTVDWWEYRIGTGTFISTSISSDYSGLLLGHSSNKVWMSSQRNSWNILGDWAYGDDIKNEWVHRAFQRRGDTLTAYQNGVQKVTTTINGTIMNGNRLLIGKYKDDAPDYLKAYIDELRINKGTALYSDNFDLSTSAYGGYCTAECPASAPIRIGNTCYNQQDANEEECSETPDTPVYKDGEGCVTCYEFNALTPVFDETTGLCTYCAQNQEWSTETNTCVNCPANKPYADPVTRLCSESPAASCLDSNAITISNKTELLGIVDDTTNYGGYTSRLAKLNLNYCLIANIDLENASWAGIGYMDYDTMDTYYYTGRFDGNGFVIKNVNIATSGYESGFFAATQNATITRLGLENLSFSSSGYSTGGLVGSASTGTLIDQCYVTGSITYGDTQGGLVGTLYNATVKNSYSTVTLGEGCQLAGLVGYVASSSVINSYATGAMSGYSYCDGYMGLIGSNYSGTITASYWDKITSATTSSNGGTGKTTIEMKVARTDSNLYSTWDEDIWCFEDGSYPKLKAVIGTDNLCVSCPLDKPAYVPPNCVTCFEAHGNAKPINNNGKCEACPSDIPKWNGTDCEACPTGSAWNGAECVCAGGSELIDGVCTCPADKPYWVPGDNSMTLLMHFDGPNNSQVFIESSQNAFTSSVYGNVKISTDHSVFGGSSAYFDGDGDYLQIDSTTAFDFANKDFTVDWWEYRINGGTIVSTSPTNNGYSGLLLPYSANRVYMGSSINSWNIMSDWTYGSDIRNQWVHRALVRKDNLIIAYTNGTQSGTQTISGSLYNGNRLLIGMYREGDRSYFQGYIDELRVNVGKAKYSKDFDLMSIPYGGVCVAECPPEKPIALNGNCYDIYELCKDYAPDNPVYKDGECTTCAEGTSIYTPFWNDEKKNCQPCQGGSAWDGTGCSCPEGTSYNGTYCVVNGTGEFCGAGDVVISSAADLAKIGLDSDYPLNGAYCLITDIDLASDTTLPETHTSSEGWRPIGDYGRNSSQFTGRFDGNGHIIRNLTINRSGHNYQGLFGWLSGNAVVTKLALENVNIKASGREHVGGITGRMNSSANINQSYVTGSISARHYVGGIVGYQDDSSSVYNSYTNVSLSNTGSHVGGIAGCYPRNIVNCYALGRIIGNDTYMGGIGGYSATNVSDTYWDILTTGVTTSYGGTGKTTSEMQVLRTLAGLYKNWSGDTWCFSKNDYPRLKAFSNSTNYCNSCSAEEPAYDGETCSACAVLYGDDKPYNNNGKCEACPDYMPLWNGTRCTVCPEYSSWNGSECVCGSDTVMLGDNTCGCPAEKPLWYNGDTSATMLLTFDGENNSKNFTGYSTSDITVTPYGDAKMSSAQSKFGGTSLYLDGSGDYLKVSVPAALKFGSGNFTFDWWEYRTGSGTVFSTSLYNTGDGSGIMSGYASAIKLYMGNVGNSSWNLLSDFTAGTYTTGTWVHRAIVKDGTQVRTYQDGVLYATVSDKTGEVYNQYNINDLSIGMHRYGDTNYFNGYIDEFRLTKNKALYSGNFTPADYSYKPGCVATCPVFAPALIGKVCYPQDEANDIMCSTTPANPIYYNESCTTCAAATSGAKPIWNANDKTCIACPDYTPLWDGTQCVACPAGTFWNGSSCKCPGTTEFIDGVCKCPADKPLQADYDTQVVLLLHFDGEDGTTAFTDSSINNSTVVNSGDVKLSKTQSKFGGTSAYFDGNGDYLTITDSDKFNFSNKDFTVDWWEYRMNTGASFTTQKNNGVAALLAGYDSVYLYMSGNTSYWNLLDRWTFANDLRNTWVHRAIVRDGSTIRTYENGVNSWSANIGTGSLYNDGNIKIGMWHPSDTKYFQGYIDEFRVTIGKKQYSSNFTLATNTYGATCNTTCPSDLPVLIDGKCYTQKQANEFCEDPAAPAYKSGEGCVACHQFNALTPVFDENTGLCTYCPKNQEWNSDEMSCVDCPADNPFTDPVTHLCSNSPAGTCLDSDAITISTKAQLLAILDNTTNYGGYTSKNDKLKLNYCLIADIDLQNAGWSGLGGMDYDIGDYIYYTGRFDGNGFVIKNVNLNGSEYLGFFGATQNATITRLGLENISVSGWGMLTGALVGYAVSTTIDQCYVSGGSIPSGETAGGLVGQTNNSTVKNSYSTIAVGEGCQIAGLVGYMYNNSKTINSYSTGAVGYSWCYDNYFGLIGYNSGSSITNSYWDTETSGAASSNGGTGKTTVEMKNVPDSSIYVGWDEGIWCFSNSAYPKLKTIRNSSDHTCPTCPAETPVYSGGSCTTCEAAYGTAKPVYKNGTCQACPSSTPAWNGTYCESCPMGATWNGAECACAGGAVLQDDVCVCPVESPLWANSIPWTQPIFTSNTNGSYTITTSHETQPAWWAFDGDKTTNDRCWWTNNIGISTSNPAWITFYSPKKLYLKSYYIRNEHTSPENLKNAIIQGSNDNTAWTDLYTISDRPNTGTYEESYKVNATTAYNYFRLYVIGVYNSGVSIQEISIDAEEFLGCVAECPADKPIVIDNICYSQEEANEVQCGGYPDTPYWNGTDCEACPTGADWDGIHCECPKTMVAIDGACVCPESKPLWVNGGDNNTVLFFDGESNLDNQGQADVTVTPTNITYSDSGYIGKAFSFNGSSSYITINNPSGWFDINKDYTVDFWVKFNTTSVQALFGSSADWSGVGAIAFHNGSRISYFASNTGNSWNIMNEKYGSIPITAGKWYHVAYVRSGSTLYSFIDGNLDWSQTISTEPSFGANTFRIGIWGNNGYYLNGLIDEFRISDVARHTTSFTPPAHSLSGGYCIVECPDTAPIQIGNICYNQPDANVAECSDTPDTPVYKNGECISCPEYSSLTPLLNTSTGLCTKCPDNQEFNPAWESDGNVCVPCPADKPITDANGICTNSTCEDIKNPNLVMISTKAELLGIINDSTTLGGVTSKAAKAQLSYCLANNIDLEGATWTGVGGMNYDTYEEIPFTGKFDGNGHIIKNMTIQGEYMTSAFFPSAVGAKISRLGIENATARYGTYNAILVGSATAGTVIDSCYVSGSSQDGDTMAGLVGFLYNSTVKNSYSMANVSSGCQLGGLIGYAYSGSVIQNSYSTGNISNSWCDDPRGFIGYCYDCSVTNSYWDTVSSGTASSSGGTGKTTAQMKTFPSDSVYTNWSEDIWCFSAADYPRLKVLNGSSSDFNICNDCPLATPVKKDGVCVTCLENYGSAKPITNNGKCEPCPSDAPKWNGTSCESCQSGSVWTGSECACSGGAVLQDDACVCPAEKPLWTTAPDSNTLLLLHFDGNINDAANNFTLTNTGSTFVDDAKIGNQAINISGGKYLNFLDSTGLLDFGTDKDFTVEFYVKTPSHTTSYPHLIAGHSWSDTCAKVQIHHSSRSGVVSLENYNNSFIINGNTPTAQDKWIHIAVVRKGSTFMIFEDGVLANTVNSGAGINFSYGGQTDMGYTTWDGGSGYFNGLVDEFRVSKVARYESNFTPPIAQFGGECVAECPPSAPILIESRCYSQEEANKRCVQIDVNKPFYDTVSGTCKSCIDATGGDKPIWNATKGQCEECSNGKVWSGMACACPDGTSYNGANCTVNGTDGFCEAGAVVISSINDLNNIRNGLAGSYCLMRDLDMAGVAWVPIAEAQAYNQNPFTGRFDGNGHIIKNLTINRTSSGGAALFGGINSSNCYIKNLGLENVDVTSSGHTVGALVGTCNFEAVVENVYVTGSVSGSTTVGCIMGYNDRCKIKNSYADCTVNATAGDAAGIGIAGGGCCGAEVYNSYSLSRVTATSSRGPVNIQGSANYSYWDSVVSGITSGAGGGTAKTTEELQVVRTIGNLYSNWSETYWCFNQGEYPKLRQMYSSYNRCVSCPVEKPEWSGLDCITCAQKDPVKPYNNNGVCSRCPEETPRWDGTACVACPANTTLSNGQCVLTGTIGTCSEGMIAITNPYDLDDIRDNLDGEYCMLNSIDMSVYDYFTPIGSAATPFTGVFNGNGNVINNLNIVETREPNVGFFGYLSGVDTIVEHVGFSNVSVIGKSRIGVVAGTNSGALIQYVYVDGVVENDAMATDGYGGAIVGMAINGARLYFAAANISSRGLNIGGLVGLNQFGSIIKDCYVKGNIYARGLYAGGIAGLNDNNSQIMNCYSSIDIQGVASYKGGLFGRNNADSKVAASHWNIDKITDAGDNLATGENYYKNEGLAFVQFQTTPTALVYPGWKFATPQDEWCFHCGGYPVLKNMPANAPDWNDCDVSCEECPPDACLTDGSEVVLGDCSCMLVCDPPGIWNIEQNGCSTCVIKDYTKPYYNYEVADCTKCPDETPYWTVNGCKECPVGAVKQDGICVMASDTEYCESGMIAVSNFSDLARIGVDLPLNGHYCLLNDIDYATDYTTPETHSTSWIPIGNVVSPFTGVFEGNGKVIGNLEINNSDAAKPQQGLFGYVSGTNTKIRNLKMTGVDIKNNLSVSNAYTGAIAGVIENSIIVNCKITGSISGGSSGAGAIAGFSSGSLSNSYSEANVTNVIAGGLVGYSTGTISNCRVTSNVISEAGPTSAAGGLVGIQQGGLIVNSYVSGTVEGTNVGGAIGIQQEGNINSTYAKNDITAVGTSPCAGGFVGRKENGAITNTYALGDVYGAGSLGGFAGCVTSLGTIVNSYCIGELTKTSDEDVVGGFVAYLEEGNENSVLNSYWDTQTSGVDISAGGLGKLTAEMKVLRTTANLYKNWDDTVWTFSTTNYPRLREVAGQGESEGVHCPSDSTGEYPSCDCNSLEKQYNRFDNVCECPSACAEPRTKQDSLTCACSCPTGCPFTKIQDPVTCSCTCPADSCATDGSQTMSTYDCSCTDVCSAPQIWDVATSTCKLCYEVNVQKPYYNPDVKNPNNNEGTCQICPETQPYWIDATKECAECPDGSAKKEGETTCKINSSVFKCTTGMIPLVNAADIAKIGRADTHPANGSYCLMNDIDLADPTIPSSHSGEDGWDPVSFSGTFEGNGRIISGLKSRRLYRDNLGLFSVLTGQVRNLGLENVDINGQSRVGAIAGTQSSGTISDCYVTGVKVAGTSYIGGVLGYKEGGSMYRAYSAIPIVTSSTATKGGLTGNNAGGVSDAYWDKQVTGVLVGDSAQAKMTEEMQILKTAYNLYKNFPEDIWTFSTEDYPRFYGARVENGIQQCISATCLSDGSQVIDYSDCSCGNICIFPQIWNPTLKECVNTCPEGAEYREGYGTCRYTERTGDCEVNTIAIQNAFELAQIGINPNYPLSANYCLSNDIDLKNDGSIPDTHSTDEGWIPIGSFSGNFYGNSHVIKNLYIRRLFSDNQALFGYLNGGTIQKLGIENADVRGYSNVGVLVGRIQSGTVSNTYALGKTEGASNIGGLVGYHRGNINNSYAAVQIITSSINKGGLIGYHETGGYSNSYYDKEMAGVDSGNPDVAKTTAEMKVVKNAYNLYKDYSEDIWTFSSSDYPKFIGSRKSGETTLCPSTSCATDGSQVIDYSNCTCADMCLEPQVWEKDTKTCVDSCPDGADLVYGVCKFAMDMGRCLTGMIPIQKASELAKIGRTELYPLNGSYCLMNDIDLAEDATLPYTHATSEGWIPIGTFSGTFEGNGKVVSNLKIRRIHSNNQGLFGRLEGGTIRNLGVEKADVNGYSYVGALVGYQYSGAVLNTYAMGKTEGSSDVSGL
ncbi:MAG: ZmpA/ZmpB/ZmpC family metallo-endopeptidase-related protein, partial [Eubacteriales bacterium]|nr:ZmpA/ZmpB/ZmpC family metallo-endopeptidase-related protein [Eubacteriales bacterium]